MEKKELIYILWLFLLTIPYLYKIIDSLYKLYNDSHKKELKKYLNDDSEELLSTCMSKEIEVEESELTKLEKYLEINAIDKFKENFDKLSNNLSNSQKSRIMAECVRITNLELVIFLHEQYQINIHSQSFDTEGKLDWAFNQGHLVYQDDEKSLLLLKYFLDNGSDPKNNESDILYKATKYGNLNAVKLLVEYGANVSDFERAAIVIAQKNNYSEMLDYLIETEKIQNKQHLEKKLPISEKIIKPNKI